MMQKVRFFLIIFLVIFIKNETHAKNIKRAAYEDYLIQITQNFSKQIKDELNLEFSGKGFNIKDKIEEFEMQFRSNRRATLEEARTLQLLVMNKFVQAINNHKGLQPYLAEIPFNYKRVQISINFDGPFGSYFDGTVARVYNLMNSASIIQSKNNFFYYTVDPITESSILLLKEPYEEAVKLVQATPIKNPRVHETTELEVLSDHIFQKFGTELGEENGLYLSTVGSNLTNGIEKIAAKFIFFSPVTIDQARTLGLIAVYKILSTVNHDPRLKPYLKPYPFPTSGLNICIEFRKSSNSTWGYSSYNDGSMDSVEIKDDVISYYRTPPIKEDAGIIPMYPPLFAKETYQEALKAVPKALNRD